MSIGGPSALGTLLVQRLDAALGVTLSQQANIASGARPDAVSQADDPSRVGSAQNETLRHPQETVDQVTARTEQQGPVAKSKMEAGQLDTTLLDSAAATTRTPSAPTTLGFAAKTILALLNLYPGEAPAIVGKTPLVDPEAGRSSAAGLASSGVLVQNVQETAGMSASTFVQALSQALQSSGLFYESLAGLNPDTHLLVRQQLEVFANQALTWSGQAWPNAFMEWRVERHESSSATPGTDSGHWASSLNLTLPHLGSVHARISLFGQQLVMRLVAPEAVDQLNEQSAQLRTRLLDSGLLLSHLSVLAAEPPDAPEATP